MTATLPRRVAALGRTVTLILADARAGRRARRVVHESCVRGKVAGEVTDDAMNVAAGLVSDMVAHDGGPVRLEVQAAPGEVTVTVRDAAGHESTASVHE
jgi:hypothetical protein